MAQPPGRRHALLVTSTLTARRPLQQLQQVLLDPGIGGYDVAQTLFRSPSDLRQPLRDRAAQLRPQDMLLICVAGHSPEWQAATWLSEGLTNVGGTVGVVLETPPYRGTPIRWPSGITVIEHQADPDGDPSPLFGLMTEALRTGEADLDGDGRISFRDLYEHLTHRMRLPSPNDLRLQASTEPLYVIDLPGRPVTDIGPLPTVEPVASKADGPPPDAGPDPVTPVDDDVEWVSDAPATSDLLRREALADVVALRLRESQSDEPDTSLLVHVDGAWGTGKSTLLNLLQTRLAGDFVVTWFDAWQQSRLAPPWWTLLAATRTQVARSRGRFGAAWLRLTETVARARRSGAPYLLALVLLLVMAGVLGYLLWPDRTTLKSLTETLKLVTAVTGPVALLWAGALFAGRFLLWDSARGARLFEQSDSDPMAEVAAHFAWLADRSVRPLVFFVDDLDRCRHEYVVEFLEAVQTLVRRFPATHERRQAVHFVVAADGAWLRRSYEVGYQPFEGSVTEPARPLGHMFLDKLFQLTVPMPELSGTAQAAYLDHMLRIGGPDRVLLEGDVDQARQTLSQQGGDENAILETLDSVDPAIRHLIAGDAALALARSPARRRTRHSLQKFAPMLQGNPRSMKKFLNTYSMLRSVRTLEGNTVPTDALALWAILLVRWPSLAECLAAQPDAVTAIADPIWITETFPEPLREVAASAEVRAVVTSRWGGPLTPALIRRCRGGDPREPAEAPPGAGPGDPGGVW